MAWHDEATGTDLHYPRGTMGAAQAFIALDLVDNTLKAYQITDAAGTSDLFTIKTNNNDECFTFGAKAVIQDVYAYAGRSDALLTITNGATALTSAGSAIVVNYAGGSINVAQNVYGLYLYGQSLIVSSNNTPGSPFFQAFSAILSNSSFALIVL